VAQVAESLPSECEAQSSAKKKKKERIDSKVNFVSIKICLLCLIINHHLNYAWQVTDIQLIFLNK
jgi:hypothetical protein